MTLKEYKQVYDKVSLSKEADERILQTLREEIPDSVVEQKKKRIRIARIAGMVAMIAIPILAVEMMRLSAVDSIEKNAAKKVNVRKGNDLIKNTHGGIEYSYPTSIYVYDDSGEESIVSSSTDYPEYENADTLVDAADLIFRGTVKEFSDKPLIKTDKAEKLPYTIFEISVGQVYKGSIDGDTIRIKRPGRRTEDERYGLSDVSDATEIRIGGTYLFLTKTYEDSYPSLVNLTQSVYSMEDEQKEEADSDGKTSNQGISLSDILDGALERKVLDKKEYSNGISIE